MDTAGSVMPRKKPVSALHMIKYDCRTQLFYAALRFRLWLSKFSSDWLDSIENVFLALYALYAAMINLALHAEKKKEKEISNKLENCEQLEN